MQHEEYVLVPADKSCNNTVFVRLIIISVFLTKIFQNHASVLNTLNISGYVHDNKLPYLYWIPKLHKTPYKQRFIAGSKNVLQNCCQYS
jgi:hypothetical protein